MPLRGDWYDQAVAYLQEHNLATITESSGANAFADQVREILYDHWIIPEVVVPKASSKGP